MPNSLADRMPQRFRAGFRVARESAWQQDRRGSPAEPVLVVLVVVLVVLVVLLVVLVVVVVVMASSRSQGHPRRCRHTSRYLARPQR